MKRKKGLQSIPKMIHDPAISATPGLSIAVLPNNRQILTAGLDFHLRLWDIETGKCVDSWEARGPIYDILVIPENIAMLGAVQGIVLWDLTRWEMCQENTLWSHSLIEDIAYCEKTGEVLGVGEDSTIHRWHLHRREKIGQLPGHAISITAVDLDVSGGLAITGDLRGEIKLWDLSTNVCLKTWQAHSKKISALRLSSNGDKVLSGSGDGSLILWDLPSGEAVCKLMGLPTKDIALSKDTRYAFSCSADGISYWDLERECLIARSPQDGIEKFALSADESVLAGLVKSNRLLVWDCSKFGV